MDEDTDRGVVDSRRCCSVCEGENTACELSKQHLHPAVVHSQQHEGPRHL